MSFLRSFAARLALIAAMMATGVARAETMTLNASQNNTIFSDQPDDSNGAGQYISCGKTLQGGIRRGLVAFDTTAIPVGSVINSVTVTLYLANTTPTATTVNIALCKATTQWGEGPAASPGDYDDDGDGDLDYDNDGDGGGGALPQTPQPDTTDATWLYGIYPSQIWNNAGGDFVATASETTPVGVFNTNEAANYYTWSGSGLVTDVQGWVNNPPGNFGWFIIGDEADTAAAVDFDSRNFANFADAAGASPSITIDYTPPSGAGVLSFNASAFSLEPLDATGQPSSLAITVTRSGGSSGAVSVDVAASGGSLNNGTDYTFNTPLSFADGATTATVTLQLGALTPAQLPGMINLSLANPAGGASFGYPTTATVTVASAGALVFSAATSSFNPLNASGSPNTFTVPLTRTGGSAGAVSVSVAATGGSLVNGTDYTITSPVTFADRATSGSVQIQLNGLTPAQLPGTIELALSDPTGDASLGVQSTATLTVLSAGAVQFSEAEYFVDEDASGNSALTIAVDRQNGSAGAVTVDVAIGGGTAVEGTDFTLPATPFTLSWADGDALPKTFVVTVPPGALTMNSTTGPTLILQLQNPTGDLAILEPSTTVTILGYDSIPPTQMLTVPVANVHYTAAQVVFSGEAKDNVRVDHVAITLNKTPLPPVVPTSATAAFKWTCPLVPEQGVNTVVVQAFDGQGNASPAVTRTFTFSNLRPQLAGNYHGLITAAAAGAAAPFNSNGLLAVTVTSTGLFTGRATLSGESYSLTGIFLDDGSGRFGPARASVLALTKPTRPTATRLGDLALTLDTGSGHVITGALTDSMGADVATIPHADQALYTSAKKPLPPMVNVPSTVLNPASENGKYTVVFQPGAAPNNGVALNLFPQGSGYATLSVNGSGGVMVTGKLPDGSVVSYSNYLSLANHLPVFISLYGNTGFLSGDVVFDPTQQQTDASGGLVWLKPMGLAHQIYYPAGWAGGIAVDLLASKYVVPTKPTTSHPTPPNPDTVLGLGLAPAPSPQTANLTIALADGDLSASTSNQASIAANSLITVLPAASGGAIGLKAVFNASTGLLSGSFTYPLTRAPVSFVGIALQKTNSAEGFFLFDPPKNSPPGYLPASGSILIAP